MKVTFLIDLYMTDEKGYKGIDLDIEVLPRKTELVTVDKYVNYIVAEVFHKIIDAKQEVSILLVPTVQVDIDNTNPSQN
jgi:hypothetical protein